MYTVLLYSSVVTSGIFFVHENNSPYYSCTQQIKKKKYNINIYSSYLTIFVFTKIKTIKLYNLNLS